MGRRRGAPWSQHAKPDDPPPAPDLPAARSHCWFTPKPSFPQRPAMPGLGHKAPGDNRDVPVPHTGSATATSDVPDLRGSTHHLVEGVAQQPVLVEDEEAALPFLQEKAERRVIPTRGDGKKALKSPPEPRECVTAGHAPRCLRAQGCKEKQLPKKQRGAPRDAGIGPEG